jgi:hypothetical protein
MGLKFNHAYARSIHRGMTVDEVLTVMQSNPYATEVHGDETHFVWAHANLAGFNEVRIRFDQSGHVIADPVIFGNGLSLVEQIRYKHAQELIKDGRNDEALKELLWCFDESRQPPEDYDVRQTGLLDAIAKLGKKYPPALAALRERRDKAEQQLLASLNDFKFTGLQDLNPTIHFCCINRVLKDDARTLQLYDKLPAKDVRKLLMGDFVSGELTTVQRYRDAIRAMNYQTMATSLDELVEAPAPFATDPNAAPLRQTPRAAAVERTAKYVEALAGSGDLPHARELAARILAYDGSAETKAILQQHAIRAGHPELLSTAQIP